MDLQKKSIIYPFLEVKERIFENSIGFVIYDKFAVSKGHCLIIPKREKLSTITKVSLVTPNIPEAEILTKKKIYNTTDMIYAANILIDCGAKNVLVKGGHLKSLIVKDVFVNKNEIKIFKHNKISTKNTHGTGCTLSSAIATYFSCGKTLKKSCELGIKYVNSAIGSNLKYGRGNGPINHLSSIIINKKFR